ncbi:hypothetical protein [Plantactinospora endophytica]|uniref:Methanolan biosynthesis EpsI domain-containing protein n=1 Tax=Plantactinospora endophytica TaxID=673535 RepID=A0ABQ4DYP3_9ACTN|nr:hypothetical protein [Plantactinospora endophytica]GIG87551.1 hypothetical protein Pen02_24870 [Plantactinospora endophytica]
MDRSVVLTVIVTVASTAVVLGVVWLWTEAETRRQQDDEQYLVTEVSGWAARNGWTVPAEPGMALARELDLRNHPGQRVVVTIEGEYAARRAAVLCCVDTREEGGRYSVALVRLDRARPELAVGQRLRYQIRSAANPSLPDGPDRDGRFDRSLRVGADSDPTAAALLTAPVRAALLDLRRFGAGWWQFRSQGDMSEFVRVRGDVLRVIVAGWAPGTEPRAFLDAVSRLAAALPGAPAPVLGDGPQAGTPPN